MTLLLAMLPYYLLGNLHCLGMCGPLTMMLGAHRFRYFYFAGRLFSFTLAGGIAGELGAVLNVFFNQF
jgi:sulfite exporter TauE/SafE